MSHKHITLSQQNEIAVLLRINTKQKGIANILGFTPSAISQEIKTKIPSHIPLINASFAISNENKIFKGQKIRGPYTLVKVTNDDQNSDDFYTGEWLMMKGNLKNWKKKCKDLVEKLSIKLRKL